MVLRGAETPQAILNCGVLANGSKLQDAQYACGDNLQGTILPDEETVAFDMNSGRERHPSRIAHMTCLLQSLLASEKSLFNPWTAPQNWRTIMHKRLCCSPTGLKHWLTPNLGICKHTQTRMFALHESSCG